MKIKKVAVKGKYSRDERVETERVKVGCGTCGG